MARCYKYISPYVSIFWTKRYVNHRPCGLRSKLKRLRFKNRIHKRPMLFQVKCTMHCKRNKFNPFQAERRNYNTVYRSIQIPINTKELK